MKKEELSINILGFLSPALKPVLLYLFIASFFTGCANQLPPGGGEVDKTPPEIVELYPANGSTLFNEGYFELDFSEFVDKRSLKDAIFISPSPGSDLQLDWSWSGKSVRVHFPSALRKNTTYIVSIGTDLVDINAHNRMASAYSFSFSTGPVVDKGEIKGRVYSEKPSGVMLFAYKKDDTSKIDPGVLKPDFISQAGDSGSFKIKGLGPGTYKVFAIEDQYRDLLFQPDQDRFGAPSQEITLSQTDTSFNDLNFYLSKYDTVKPRVLTSVMTDMRHILVNMNEELDSSAFNIKNFYIIDSTSGKKTEPVYSFKGNTKLTEFVLSINSELVYENSNFLVLQGIKDLSGNITPFDYVKLTTGNRKDTSKTYITRFIPQQNETVDFIKPVFRFSCDDAFDSALVKKSITCTDTSGRPFKYSLRFIDDASFCINAEEELVPKQEFRIKFDFNKFVNLSGNKLDSTFVYRFKTISGLDFTGVSGIINNVDLTKNPILVLQGTDKGKLTYIQKPDTAGKFNFERIEAGKYTLWCYYDTNHDSKYSNGSLYPFVPSERFFYYKNIIELRPRWAVTDIIFEAIK